MKRRLKILIIYKCLDFPLRTTIKEHLYSFRKYSGADCYYLMLDIGKDLGNSKKKIPAYLNKIDFDIILFHYGFLSTRSNDISYQRAYEQVLRFRNKKALKAILPQDEYVYTERLVHFVNNFNIDVVFSVSPESEWKKLYRGVDFNKVKFYKVLTGYLDDESIEKINEVGKGITKDIDIGYRARKLPQWLGRHGYMKTEIADIFNKASVRYELKTDISVDPKDTFFGDEWYKFIIRCKYMIGVEGGATIYDPDGSIATRGSAYIRKHPDCTFEEIETNCFPGLDGKLQLVAISPRHLEACATRTCQLLLESSFNGILKPGIHYIEIKKDFSNLDEVLKLVKNDTLRKDITERAYKDIVESGAYSYKNFVNFVIEKCVPEYGASLTSESRSRLVRVNHFLDNLSWKKYYFWLRIYPKVINRWTYLIPLIKIGKLFGLKLVFRGLQKTLKKNRENLL